MTDRDIHVADETSPSLGGVHHNTFRRFSRPPVSDVLRHLRYRRDPKKPEALDEIKFQKGLIPTRQNRGIDANGPATTGPSRFNPISLEPLPLKNFLLSQLPATGTALDEIHCEHFGSALNRADHLAKFEGRVAGPKVS